MNRFERPANQHVIESTEGKQGTHYLRSLRRVTPTTQSTFAGLCFNCGYANHSSNYCPLKKCRKCGLYSHIEKTHHQE